MPEHRTSQRRQPAAEWPQRASQESAESISPPTVLTPRQREILFQVAHGRTNRRIGEALGISERTVRNHMRSILRKLSSSDRTNAVVIAIGHGWIPIPIERDEEAVKARRGRPTSEPA